MIVLCLFNKNVSANYKKNRSLGIMIPKCKISFVFFYYYQRRAMLKTFCKKSWFNSGHCQHCEPSNNQQENNLLKQVQTYLPYQLAIGGYVKTQHYQMKMWLQSLLQNSSVYAFSHYVKNFSNKNIKKNKLNYFVAITGWELISKLN